LKKGQAKGEVASSADTDAFARYIHNALIGIRVSVKMTPDQQELETTIDMMLSILKNVQ
jgi:TetR/AcrR family transcriptional repressor of nem operon